MAIAGAGHFKDDLRQQLRMRELPERDLQLAEYLVDVLDHHGIMDRDLDEVADDLSFHLQTIVDVADIERILKADSRTGANWHWGQKCAGMPAAAADTWQV